MPIWGDQVETNQSKDISIATQQHLRNWICIVSIFVFRLALFANIVVAQCDTLLYVWLCLAHCHRPTGTHSRPTTCFRVSDHVSGAFICFFLSSIFAWARNFRIQWDFAMIFILRPAISAICIRHRVHGVCEMCTVYDCTWTWKKAYNKFKHGNASRWIYRF